MGQATFQMGFDKLLIANRGEIAVRIIRTAREAATQTVAVFSEDDADSLHVRYADESFPLKGRGARAYLDMEQLISVARSTGAKVIHPGYGFLAENTEFARRCEQENLLFIGPSVETLSVLGDKIAARDLAVELDIPVLPGSRGPVTPEVVKDFFSTLDGNTAVIKAAAGGGGRGMAIVSSVDEIDAAYARCQSEARMAFGSDALYVEEFFQNARHIEVQIIGDGQGAVLHLGERECSVQRRHQKLIEIAPSPALDSSLQKKICDAAVKMGQHLNYHSLGTFEFLVDTETGRFAFIEANPRLQVEHTVTEEVMGLDLVEVQLALASGASLADLTLPDPEPHGFAIQARVNAEQMTPDGNIRPTSGRISSFDLPSGPGIRVDTCGFNGYNTNPAFDSLLAKVIAHSNSPQFGIAVNKLSAALDEFQIMGVETNKSLLSTVLRHENFKAGDISTRWLDNNLASLLKSSAPATSGSPDQNQAGAAIDKSDPLASLGFYRGKAPPRRADRAKSQTLLGPPGTQPIPAPLQATVIEIHVNEGEPVRQGQMLFVLSALKMEHVVAAPCGGIVHQVTVSVDDTVYEDYPLCFIEARDVGEALEVEDQAFDPDYIRPGLQALFDRRQFGLDRNRPAAVERRHSKGRRTVRENIDQLIDEGTWMEYGSLTIAGQRARRSVDELIRKTPADGLVAGIGSINGEHFDEKRARTMFISYDDTVLAGTQGARGHDKTDRMMELADQLSLPLIFHAEGAGGRSGETEIAPNIHPSVRTFEKMAQLSGKVPMIGVTAGWCYAGNAAILGLTDIIIATDDSLIAMGGPATIAGGGMGAFHPEEVGAISDTAPAGTVDVIVKSHDEAIAASKQCLSYFQGSIDQWQCADQRELRHVIPENRHRTFDIRRLIHTLADTSSVLELKAGYGTSMITAFIRIEGHPFGLTANNNAVLGGAIDSPGSDKVARFWQICDAFNIPIISLVDTPGMMVGPEVEKTGLVRHCSRLFVTGANLETPRFSIILRKGYALGSLAMMTGSSRASAFTVSWPDGEFAGMNIESGVLLANRKSLEQIDDVEERAAIYRKMVESAYENSGALHSASVFGIDEVIDPAETRQWIVAGLKSVPESEPLRRGRGKFLDTW